MDEIFFEEKSMECEAKLPSFKAKVIQESCKSIFVMTRLEIQVICENCGKCENCDENML